MANTIVQIKRSTTSATPPSLQYGELAYSFNSGKLFIGDSANNAIDIGGNTYNQIINAATSLNTPSTIVKRDAAGNFSTTAVIGSLYGNANTASKWLTARVLGVNGDATGTISVDGSANANIPLTLVNTTVSAGTYGGAGQIPVFTVDSKGRLTFAGNSSISTAFSIAGNTGTDSVNTGETLTIEGSGGIYTTVTNNKLSINVDSTVVRTSGNQSVNGNLTVSGNLIVNGNTTTIDVSILSVEDSLIRLANNNVVSDSVDIGFYGSANPGTLGYYGIARTVADNGNFFVFKGLPTDPTGNTISASSVTYANTGTLRASLTGGVVSGLYSAIGVTDGGTGIKSVTTGDILYANGTNTIATLSTVATGNVLISGTTPSWGKVGLTTHVSGVLGISNGGTNASSVGTAGSVAYSNGSAYNFTSAGTLGQALISGATGPPTFGTLDLRGGGIGLTSVDLVANSVLFYTGSGNSLSKTNTPTDGQVLQYSLSGGVSFGMLDGGSF